MAENKKTKVFYGWFLLVACWLMTAVVTGMFVNTMNQYVVPVCEALNISRTQFSITNSCVSVAVMALSPFVGQVFSKGKQRLIVTVAALAALTGWLGFSVAGSIEMFYVFGILMGVGSAFSGAVICNIVLNNWFHAKKGFAMGFATTGSGFGSTVFNPIASSLIASYGYQAAVRYMGLIALMCMLPFLILFVYKPEQKGLLPYGDEAGGTAGSAGASDKKSVTMAQNEGMTRAEALRSGKFWGVCFIACSLSLGAIGLFSHMTPYLSDIGYEPVQAAKFISIMSITMAISKVVFGWLNDRIGTFMNFMILMAISVIGMASLLFAQSEAIAYIASFGFGVAFSTTNLLSPLITVHALGGKDFSNIFGLVSFAIYLGPLISSPLSGMIYDHFGNYSIAVIFYTVLYALALVVGFFVLRHGYTEKKD